MKKADFAKAMAEKYSISDKEAEKAMNMVLDTITENLVKGEEVQFTGFGKFRISLRKPSVAVINKQKVSVPARNAVVFSAGKILKAAVNNDSK